MCWEWKSKVNSTVFALLVSGSTPSHAAQHCLILSMSFSISGPQFPHLLDDGAGLDHLQMLLALTCQDSFVRGVS